jgi:hypothetical protein
VVECLHCAGVLVYHGNTSGMISHLRSQHQVGKPAGDGTPKLETMLAVRQAKKRMVSKSKAELSPREYCCALWATAALTFDHPDSGLSKWSSVERTKLSSAMTSYFMPMLKKLGYAYDILPTLRAQFGQWVARRIAFSILLVTKSTLPPLECQEVVRCPMSTPPDKESDSLGLPWLVACVSVEA